MHTSIPMTGQNLGDYVPKEKIFLLEELKGSTLQKLLPKEKDYIIVLFETVEDNNGHWTALLRYKENGNEIIEFFDSYGNTPKEVYQFNSKLKNNKLNQNRNYLSDLIMNYMKSNKNALFIYNNKKLQAYGDDIATCGRWVIFRIFSLMKRDMNLYSFIHLFRFLKNILTFETNDEIVSLIVR